MIVCLLVLLYIVFLWQDKKTTTTVPEKRQPTFLELERGGAVREDSGGKQDGRSYIQSVRLVPQHPTLLDPIKAEITASYKGQGKLTYEFHWMINGKPAGDVKGDTLPTGLYRKKDQISVTVIPLLDGVPGFSYESMFVVVHNSAPSLELKGSEQHKLSDSLELQLVASDSDGDAVTFGLEDPIPEGMSINKDTGKIRWTPNKKEKGTYSFRAYASDTDGTKVSKTFQFSVTSN